MNDTLVNHNTAILAKEKGFDLFCENVCFDDGTHRKLRYFEGDGDGYAKNTSINSEYDEYICTKPTQSLLQKWFRENHNIDIISIPVRWTGHEEIAYWTYAIKSIQPVGKELYKFNTYEEALETGLVEALNRI